MKLSTLLNDASGFWNVTIIPNEGNSIEFNLDATRDYGDWLESIRKYNNFKSNEAKKLNVDFFCPRNNGIAIYIKEDL